MGKTPDRYEDEHREYMRFSIFQACAIDDIKVSPECLRVLAALGSYASKRNDYWCWTALDKIARRIGVTAPAISKHVNNLATLGYLQLLHDFTDKGKQMSNAYRLIMDYELPPERQRSMYDRPRAGIGGRKKSGTEDDPGLTQSVKPRVNSQLNPGLTQSVKPRVNSQLNPGLTQSVKQIWESETEKLRNREVEPVPVSFLETKTETAEAERPHSKPATLATPQPREMDARTAEPPTPQPPAPAPLTLQQEFTAWLAGSEYSEVPGQRTKPIEKRQYEDHTYKRLSHHDVMTVFLASRQRQEVAV